MINEGLLTKFTLNREGFNEKVSIGDLLDYKGNRYVIISAFSVKLKRNVRTGNPVIEVQVIAQNINLIPSKSKYNKKQEIEKKINIAKHDPYDSIDIIGKHYIQELEDEEIAYKVTGLNGFKYKFTDLVLCFDAELITPWSKHEVDQAVKENRLSKFKIVS